MTDENQTTNSNNNEDKFNEIKNRYETELSEKDKEIAELKKQLDAKDKEVDTTIQNLNNEVNEKLKQNEEYKELQKQVNELLRDKAEALVDKYINEGKLLKSKRKQLVDLCLKDPDTVIELYENAPPIVQIGERQSQPVYTEHVSQLTNYFK